MSMDVAEIAGRDAEQGCIAMLTRDHVRMRKAGTALAEAALYVIREHDGLHRLSLAVAAWATAVANEGDRPHLLNQDTNHD